VVIGLIRPLCIEYRLYERAKVNNVAKRYLSERFQMHFATKRRQTQILVWLIWAVALCWPKERIRSSTVFNALF
jgi:hypothetical protein